MRLHIDYETRSPVDLIGCGVYAYADSPHTQVILAGWAIDEGPFHIWRILRGDPIPMELHYALTDPNTTLVAHNAGFERVMSIVVGLRQGFLPKDVWEAIRAPERWSCTAARAAACGLPRALENVAKALHLDHKKDMEGHRLMLEMCSPRGIDLNGRYIWLEDEPRMVRLGQYCIGDGLAEREADQLLPEFSDSEKAVYCVTEMMNDRGVLVDNKLLMSLITLTRDATGYLNARMNQLTNGQVPAVTNPGKIVQWLKNYGIDTQDDKIGKWIIAGLLENEELPPIVREVLVIRRDGGKSSTAKFNSLMKRMNSDSRIRGSLLYAGAAATARWSSKGVQLQNLPRVKTVKNMGAAITAVLDNQVSMRDIEQQFGPPMVVASELVRPVFIAPDGYWLARSDYSQIETRVTAWLAGERRLLDAFRAYDAGTGPDLYIVTAADVCGVPVSAIDKDDPRRQTGKVTILACMFGGGKRALANMAKLYGIQLSEKDAEAAVQAVRDANSNVRSFWYDLDRAAIACMQGQPGEIHQVRNGIWFKRNNTVLAMHLPSGRHLAYWYPQLEMKEMPWQDQNGNPAMKECVTYYAEDSQKHIWRRFTAWHGLWCENCLAGDTEVLTDSGWKHLEQVQISDHLWDGVEWVTHDGLIDQGTQNVIEFAGVWATPDHQVLTDAGMAACATTTATDAHTAFSKSCRIPSGYAGRRIISGVHSAPQSGMEMSLRLRGIQRHAVAGIGRWMGKVLRLLDRPYEGQRYASTPNNTWDVEACSLWGVALDGSAVLRQESPSVSQLRRAWDTGVRCVAKVRQFLGGYGVVIPKRADDREDEQQFGLFPHKLRMGYAKAAGQQYQGQFSDIHSLGANDSSASRRSIWHRTVNTILSNQSWMARFKSIRSTRLSKKDKIRVFDLLNAGPRHRFTVRGKDGRPFIVSNCVQATARDIMAHALVLLEKRGMKPILTVHDEAICQLSKQQYPTDKLAGEAVRQILLEIPNWAYGLPIEADGSAADRYVKG